MCPLVDCVACGIVPGKEEEEEEDCVLSRFPRRVERGRQKGEKGDIFILVVRCRRSGKVSRTFLEENEENVSIAVIIDERARVMSRGLRRRGEAVSFVSSRRRRRRKSIFHDESNIL